MHAKTKRNASAGGSAFGGEIFQAGDFVAAITQYTPDKGFQMVRYYHSTFRG